MVYISGMLFRFVLGRGRGGWTKLQNVHKSLVNFQLEMSIKV